ncbi:hypothetical protein ACH5RR_029751 [Cinchona calisaya]|uniref:Uncharacterized protein n=1 Tax=Cinchona calisaya TaxID=153742 RepID=A0ABD2YSJ3_9GENT
MKQLEVISIARVGGDLGTLASSISHHPLIVDHFQVLKDLHSLVTCRNWREMAEEIGNEIHNDLKGKRYLFLFENTGCWDAFKMYFPDDANGSKLIVYSAFPFLNEAKILQHCSARNLAVDEASSELFLSPQLVALAGKVKSIKEEIIHICNNCFNFTMEIPGFRKFSDENLPRESTTPSFREEKVVGFDEEAMALQDKLTGQLKHLEVICIVGMAGIGKTTLAKRLYNDIMMVYHFHIRAWASVSQAYEKGNFLRKLLHFLINDKESLRETKDQDMEVKLYKCLKEKRYLIVVDDIWDIGVWNDIKVCFPDDNNGSKILMTSRIKDVALNVSHRISPLFLRFLSQDESWDLFMNKVFADQSCPQQLTEIGTKLVAKCRGLPLAVVVVTGFLSKKEKTYECWSQVAENIASYFSNDEEEFSDILALSYDYLPHMLKSCFLYLGVFPEDYEIPARRLIQLWIAEGFIQQTEEKSLEDVADDYLMNLIGRNLVMVVKKRSDGGVKTCYIHDVLRNFCIRKAKENNFLLPNCWYETKASSFPFRPIYFNNYFCSHDDFSLSQFKIYRDNLLSYNFLNVCIPLVAFQKQNMLLYNPLRVLDLGCIFLIRFPFEVLQLVHLKYLVLWIGSMTYLPPVIHILRNLETFILEVERVLTVTLPHDVWKMVKLRHLHISPLFKFEIPWTSEPFLYNLKPFPS